MQSTDISGTPDPLRVIADSATMMIWMSDTDGICQFVSASNCVSTPRTGFRINEWLEFIHPEDRMRLATQFKDVIEFRRKYEFEYRLVRSDGSIRWMRSSAAPRHAETGAFLGYVGAITEVTPLHEALLNLAKSEAALRMMVENSAVLISHHAAESGNYLYASTSSEALLGYPSSELLGTSCYDSIHPDDQSVVRAEILRQAAGAPAGGLTEFRMRHKAGHYLWMGANIQVLRAPLTGEKLGCVAVTRSIEQERRSKEELKRSEERFRDLANLSSDWYWETDEHGRFTFVSEGLQRLFAIDPAEVIGKTRTERALNATEPGLLEYLAKISAREAFRDIEYTVFVPQRGTVGYSAISGEPVFEDGRFVGYRGVGRDITERIQARQRLEQLANHDALTGLPNRSCLSVRLEHLLQSVGPAEKIAVLFIDLDRFKEINDTLGHGLGDELLNEVAKRLKQNLRPNDLVARLGGDEFVIAAPCANGRSSAKKLVEKLLKLLEAPMDIGGNEVFVRASIGISMFPDDGETKESLLQNADIAMYRAKEEGRNGYRFFQQEMGRQVKELMTIENALHRALERKEFELHYQPRMDLASMKVIGMEALIRWNHPHLGRVSPLDFIPVAEERGFISPIGKWVLAEACRFGRQMMDQSGKELRLSVNLSARQLRDGQLVHDVRAALEAAALLPQFLELELTETALVDDLDASADTLQKLKALGVSLAVDDFGTGYSGLAYLGQFPLDVLKLDRSFINQKSQTGPGSRRVIQAFIEMAHSLGLKVVAEGVETEDVLEFLRQVRCDEAQGYLIAKPLTGQEFSSFFE